MIWALSDEPCMKHGSVVAGLPGVRRSHYLPCVECHFEHGGSQYVRVPRRPKTFPTYDSLAEPQIMPLEMEVDEFRADRCEWRLPCGARGLNVEWTLCRL